MDMNEGIGAASLTDIQLKPCSYEDLNLLAVLNKQLIEDEGHDNPMNTEQLKQRMKLFLDSDYCGWLFLSGGKAVGYALVNMKRSPLYLRQFFICRENRRSGFGKLFFQMLLSHLGVETIDLEVLACNERGRAFWESMGFRERSLYLRYSDNKPT